MIERAWLVCQALLQPVVDPASRTWLPTLLIGALVAIVVTGVRRGRGAGLRAVVGEALGLHLWRHRSSLLDVQLLIARRLLFALGAVPRLGSAWLLAVWLVRTLDGALGVPQAPELPLPVLSLLYSFALFVAWDASRYVLHRLMHEVPALWELHQVHHSAEVLTPLTFHRVHPLESALYELRGLLVTGTVAGLAFWLYRGAAIEWTLMGVHALGLVLNAATGNLRHSHVWLGFGAAERWLLSPAQHHLHHSLDPADHGVNYGTWLACWDRMGGSLKLAGAPRALSFGLAADARNHEPHQLVDVLVGPVLGLGRALLRRPRAALSRAVGALVLLGLSNASRAEPVPPEDVPPVALPEDAAPDDADAAGLSGRRDPDDPEDRRRIDPAAYEIIVYNQDGVPRVAGSAHVIGEEELERFEYDDIGRVLAKVPGVYVRGEDGFGLRPNIGMRGGNSDRSAKITLLEDGVPLAPAPYAAPAAYYFPMPTRLVGVEVFKGPAATRHGPQTIGGAVNLVTREVPEEVAGQMDVAVGMRSTAKVHGWFGAGNERAGFLIEGAQLTSAGFKRLDTGGKTGFERQDLMFKGRLASAPGDVTHGVELKLGYGREVSHETYLGLTADDFAADPYRRYAASELDLMRWDRVQESLSWRVSAPSLEIRTVAYHHYLTRAWTKLNGFAGGPALHDLLVRPDGGQAAVYSAILRGAEDTSAGDQALMIGTNDRQLHSFGLQTLARHSAGGQHLSNDLEVGLRLHGDHVTRLHTEDPFAMTDGRLQPTDGDTQTLLHSVSVARAAAVHVHDDLKVGPLHVLPGVRVEAIRTAVGHPDEGPQDPMLRVATLPGVGVLGEVTRWLDAFAGAHRGFSPVAPGQPLDVLPETAWSYEAGLRAADGDAHVEAVGFFSDYSNLAGQCTLSGGCDETQIDRQYNGGEVWVYGLEALAGHTVWLPGRVGVSGELSYTWTESSFRTGFRSEFPQFGEVVAGDRLPYVPVHQGAARLIVEHDRGSVAVAANARGGMRDVAGQGELPELAAIPGMVMLDVAADYALTGRVTAYGTVSNVTNAVVLESWRPFGARPAAPITAMVGVKASL